MTAATKKVVPETEETVSTTVRFPKSLLKDLKQFCLDEETTIQAAITQSVRDLLKKRGK
jgi:hypothetical protein